MSTLASRLRALAADLPAPGLETADAHLEGALSELTEASRESNTEIGIHRLGAAREHLATARTRLAEASGAVDDYLESIGAGTAAATGGTSVPVSAPAPSAPVRGDQWWTDRVNELCERTGDADPAPTPPTRLFNELLKAAAAGDGDGYHRRLRDAGPETGVKLPGLAWPLVRTLAAERLGRAATPGDLAVLRDRCAGRVRSLVPAAEPDDITAALASACTLGPPRRGDAPGDAATTAAIGPALVAALHRLPRR